MSPVGTSGVRPAPGCVRHPASEPDHAWRMFRSLPQVGDPRFRCRTVGYMPTYVPNGHAVNGVPTSGVVSLPDDVPPTAITPIPEPDQPAAVESPEPQTHAGPALASGQDAAERARLAGTPIPDARAAIGGPESRW